MALGRQIATCVGLLAIGALMLGCGGSDQTSAEIPPNNAEDLTAKLSLIGERVSEGDCEGADTALANLETAVEQTAADNGQQFTADIKDLLGQLGDQISTECQQNNADSTETTSSSTTDSTETTETTTTTTSSTEAKTTTDSTSTEPTQPPDQGGDQGGGSSQPPGGTDQGGNSPSGGGVEIDPGSGGAAPRRGGERKLGPSGAAGKPKQPDKAKRGAGR